MAQELVARISAARSPEVARRSSMAAGGIYLAVGLIPVYLGLVAPGMLGPLEHGEVANLILCCALDSFDRTRPELLWRLQLLAGRQPEPDLAPRDVHRLPVQPEDAARRPAPRPAPAGGTGPCCCWLPCWAAWRRRPRHLLAVHREDNLSR